MFWHVVQLLKWKCVKWPISCSFNFPAKMFSRAFKFYSINDITIIHACTYIHKPQFNLTNTKSSKRWSLVDTSMTTYWSWLSLLAWVDSESWLESNRKLYWDCKEPLWVSDNIAAVSETSLFISAIFDCTYSLYFETESIMAMSSRAHFWVSSSLCLVTSCNFNFDVYKKQEVD